jgi:hypothetical protein
LRELVQTDPKLWNDYDESYRWKLVLSNPAKERMYADFIRGTTVDDLSLKFGVRKQTVR